MSADNNANDTGAVLAQARRHAEPLIAFLRDIVAIESLSGQEEAVVRRIREEMLAVGFDEVKFDPLGNVLGRIGPAAGVASATRRVIAFDAHVDTVAVGDRTQWDTDPFAGTVADGKLFGRGAVDQKAGMAAMVYAGKLIKDLGLHGAGEIWMVGSVMEEDCDGLCWHHLLREQTLTPELVVSTEPTGLKIHRGQRGRLEMRVRTRGVACHGSMPHLGDNAIYKLNPAIAAVEALNERLASDPFLGGGTCAVTWIGSDSPSLCAVPDQAGFHIDRRLTVGETAESAVAEVEAALTAAGVEAEVYIPDYEEPAWTGLVYPMRKYYPTWLLPEDHPALAAAAATCRTVLDREPEIARWNFSTNGVAIMGLHDVPCIGFGPGPEEMAHRPNEFVPVDDVIEACAFYAAFPNRYFAEVAAPR